jgi:hypothetical protein
MTAVDHPTVVRAVPASGRLVAAAAFAMPPVILLAVAFGLALRGGGVTAEQWQPIAIGIAASLLVLAAVGAVPRIQPAALPTLLSLVALLVWSAASLAWSLSREATYEQVLRLGMLAAAVFVGVAFAARPRAALLLASALAVSGAAAAATVEFMLLNGDTDIFSGSRLSWPINYANADAAFVWLPLPALVALATSQPLRPLFRAGFGLFAALALAVGLTSESRGGAIALAGALLASVAIARDRGRFGLTLLVVIVPVAAMAPQMLGGDPASSSDVVRDRGQAALLAAVVAGALVCGLALVDRRRRFRFGAWAAPAAAAAWTIALVLALGAFLTTSGRPDTWLSARWDEFTNVHSAAASGSDATHFGSGTSNRYDYWRVAWHTFEDDPLQGAGAGAFSVPWFRSRSIDENVTDAHSWQAGALAETGLVGLLLTAAVLLLPLGRTPRARRGGGAWPIAAVALGGAGVYFVLHASLDWLFRIPAIAIPGFVVLGALATGGTAGRLVLVGVYERVGIALAAVAALLLLVPTYVSTTETNRAQDEAAFSDNSALERLDRAERLNPFSAEPLIVKALVLQQNRRNGAALDAAARAAERGRNDFKAWIVLGQIERASGDTAASRAAYRRARALNPRSPVFDS